MNRHFSMNGVRIKIMKKRLFVLLCLFSLIASLMTACGGYETGADKAAALKDGQYDVKVDTDSSMFHLNETCDGKGVLSVVDGDMSVHITLVSKKITKLFAGTAEDAQKDGAELIEPTLDQVEYSDGYKEEVYGFDVPVPALDQEFSVAILGSKGNWYDHKVIVSSPEQ